MLLEPSNAARVARAGQAELDRLDKLLSVFRNKYPNAYLIPKSQIRNHNPYREEVRSPGCRAPPRAPPRCAPPRRRRHGHHHARTAHTPRARPTRTTHTTHNATPGPARAQAPEVAAKRRPLCAARLAERRAAAACRRRLRRRRRRRRRLAAQVLGRPQRDLFRHGPEGVLLQPACKRRLLQNRHRDVSRHRGRLLLHHPQPHHVSGHRGAPQRGAVRVGAALCRRERRLGGRRGRFTRLGRPGAAEGGVPDSTRDEAITPRSGPTTRPRHNTHSDIYPQDLRLLFDSAVTFTPNPPFPPDCHPNSKRSEPHT